jgi:phosphoribosylaminoimidazole-succinocarboxamide synthase
MNTLKTVDIPKLGEKKQGKVRDYYVYKDKRILITTDRISAFDRLLDVIPYKGEVLNRLSAYWFDNTRDIIPNHIEAIPDPNVTIAKNAQPIPIEMVIRGYITGVTITSIWGSYQKGERTIYGLPFPDGLRKNQKLPIPIITPTTKPESGHDERLTRDEVLRSGIVSKKMYEEMENATYALFERGTKLAAKRGMILVDTKYEFGILNGKLILIDEIHTPDSSRFWIKNTYQGLFKKGLEPENFDKEFLRLWFAKKGYTGDGKPPKMPESFIKKVSKRYVDIFEKITGEKIIRRRKENINNRIIKNLAYYGMPK